ncbi:MAG: efflux RND transporter permease subunit [Paludibaculum sp.]
MVGVAMMLIGENSRVVVDRVKQKLSAIQRSLPPGVRVEPLYDRTDLVRRTIGTVSRNLLEGGLLVVAVLLLLLGSFKGGVMVSLAIPLSMLAAFTGMVQANISGNLRAWAPLISGWLSMGRSSWWSTYCGGSAIADLRMSRRR